jgi:hypothetical protein
MTVTSPGKGIRELIGELVELQDRMDAVRRDEYARRATSSELHHELVRLTHREGEVIAALRRQRLR